MALAKKREKFFDVEIPILGKKTQLKANEISELDGRHLSYDLTRILRGKESLLRLKVSAKNNKVTSSPIELRLLPVFLKKALRKGVHYVEDSFLAKCKDSTLRIKPFLVTRRTVSRKVRKALREKAKEELISYFEQKDHYQIFEEVLKNKLQKELSTKLKKIYPLSLCEIRVMRIEKEKE